MSRGSGSLVGVAVSYEPIDVLSHAGLNVVTGDKFESLSPSRVPYGRGVIVVSDDSEF